VRIAHAVCLHFKIRGACPETHRMDENTCAVRTLQHWRAFPTIFRLRTAPVLVFHHWEIPFTPRS
jgi:hypothetical protein